MTAFLVRRCGFALVTLFAVLTLVFVLVRIVPGDPAQLILGDQASRETIEALRQRLGLDKSLFEQYSVFIAGALRGDWGTSLVTGRPVIGEVLNVLPWTIELTLLSLAIGIVIGVPLGVAAAVRRNRFVDYAARIASLLGLSFPPLSRRFCCFWVLPSLCAGFRSSAARMQRSMNGISRSLCRLSISA